MMLYMLAFSLTFVFLFLFTLFSANDVGVGFWFACAAFLTIWPELGMVFLGMGYWMLSIMFVRWCRSCCTPMICTLLYCFAVIQLI